MANVTGLRVLYYLCSHVGYCNTRWRGSLVSRQHKNNIPISGTTLKPIAKHQKWKRIYGKGQLSWYKYLCRFKAKQNKNTTAWGLKTKEHQLGDQKGKTKELQLGDSQKGKSKELQPQKYRAKQKNKSLVNQKEKQTNNSSEIRTEKQTKRRLAQRLKKRKKVNKLGSSVIC